MAGSDGRSRIFQTGCLTPICLAAPDRGAVSGIFETSNILSRCEGEMGRSAVASYSTRRFCAHIFTVVADLIDGLVGKYGLYPRRPGVGIHTCMIFHRMGLERGLQPVRIRAFDAFQILDPRLDGWIVERNRPCATSTPGGVAVAQGSRASTGCGGAMT